MNQIVNDKTIAAYGTTYAALCEVLKNETGHAAPVAAMQFACTFSLSDELYRIEPLLIAHDDYDDLLGTFIEDEGSILFAEVKKAGIRENYEALSGEEQLHNNSKPRTSTSLIVEKHSANANFEVWNDYLSRRKFGKYSIWLSLVDKADDNWRFSIDFFLILNVDVTKQLPAVKASFHDIRGEKNELRQWQFKNSVFNPLYEFIDNYGTGIISKALGSDVKRHATRAAIAQVMARNLSHNVGSHVLTRLANIAAIESVLQPGRTSVSTTGQYQGFLSNNECESEPERLLTTFNSYLKSRMDFLADITTGVPTIENSKWLFRELLAGIDGNRLLLNRISGISHFPYRLTARNYVSRSEDDPVIQEILEGEQYKVHNDILVSIPNDVLGCHAFYVILENIIRNSAKHGSNEIGGPERKNDNPLKIIIDVQDCTEAEGKEFYEVTIYDDEPISGSASINLEDHEERKKYKPFSSQEDGNLQVSYLEKLVFDQNRRLNKSVLRSDGALRKGAWGLIEMDASAAYLRKIPIESIDEEAFSINLDQSLEAKHSRFPKEEHSARELNILKAVAIQGKYLGYRLFLYKPRDILIIDDDNIFDSVGEGQRAELLRAGILLATKGAQVNSAFSYDAEKIYNHKLVVIFSDKPDKIIAKNSTGLSPRILGMNRADASKHSVYGLLADDIQLFKEAIWKLYVKGAGYELYYRYTGFRTFPSDNTIKEVLRNPDSEKISVYCDHALNYETAATTIKGRKYTNEFKEIRYSGVEGFLPTDSIGYIQHVESIHNRIVVIDERIQEYAMRGEYRSSGKVIRVGDIYDSTNIHVPSECNLGSRDFHAQYGKILEVFRQNAGACFFIVHLGIVEKLIDSHNKRSHISRTYNKDSDIRIYLEDVICHPNKIDYNRLILISGRGIPHNLPVCTRYLNYSIISQYMIDLRFKYLLSEAVFSSRRIKG